MKIWEVLEIDETSDEKKIKKAYAKMLAKHHPEDEPEKFQEIKEAYELALNSAKEKSKYARDETFFSDNSDFNIEKPSSFYEWKEMDWDGSPIIQNENKDSIFTNIEELDQLDQVALEKDRDIIDKLIVELKAIKEPDITAEKLERLMAKLDCEMMVSNLYFLNFTKELKKYLDIHSSFLARRQHLFAIIKNGFDYMYADFADYGDILYSSSNDVYEFNVWLNEFEKNLQERYKNIQMMDQQYTKSFTWDADGNKTFDQQYKQYNKRSNKVFNGTNEQVDKRNRMIIIGTIILFIVLVISSLSPREAPPLPSTFPQTLPPLSLPSSNLPDQANLEAFELYIYQMITEYLFEEYGEEFSTHGTMLEKTLPFAGFMATTIYYAVDDPEYRVLVAINYEIDEDDIEITGILQVPLNLDENEVRDFGD